MAGDQGGYPAAKIGVAVKVNRDRFNCERGVAPIHVLEEGKLWIARKIGILAAAADKL